MTLVTGLAAAWTGRAAPAALPEDDLEKHGQRVRGAILCVDSTRIYFFDTTWDAEDVFPLPGALFDAI